MKIKLITAIVLLSMVLVPNLVLATSVQTKINVTNGTATVRQTIGDQTIEIETNESANIFTEIKDSIVNFFVEATGKGKLEASITGEHSVTAIADDVEETDMGVGLFSRVYEFFKKIVFFGWSREMR